MIVAAKQAPLFPATLLAGLGINDLSKIVSQTFDSQPQLGNRTITYREQTTVFMDDIDAEVRIVVRLTVETKKRGDKRVLVPNSFPNLQVGKLRGYDAVKNTWGNVSHDTDYLQDTDLSEAWDAHQQLEAIRSTMKREGPYNWSRVVS